MRVFCIQNGLRDRHSHFLQESLGILAAGRQLGVPVRLYGHRSIEPEQQAATGAVPAFTHAPSIMLETDPVYGVLSDYIDMAEIFAADCAALSADGAGAGDLVLLPYAHAWQLRGLALWLAGLPPGARPRVAAHFVMPERNWWLQERRSRIHAEPSFLRHAVARLRAVADGVVLAAVDPRLGALVAAISDLPCRPVPMPMRYPPDAELERLRGAGLHEPLDVCIAGQFRREKGSDLVPEVLAGLARAWPGARVSVQVNDRAGAIALAEVLGPAADRLELRVRVGECGAAEWYARILATRLMLLPYEPVSYAARTSGIFCEAAACGVPMVVPADTWLSDQIAAGLAAGVAFGDFTADSVLAALAQAEAAQAVLSATAARRSAYWRREQTAAAWFQAMLTP